MKLVGATSKKKKEKEREKQTELLALNSTTEESHLGSCSFLTVANLFLGNWTPF
jgi:hypothetical protein